MSRMYAVTASKKAETVSVDLFDIAPATQKAIEIVGLFIGQSSDFGDAQAEIIPYQVVRGNTTVGSGGAAAEIVPIDPNDPAASFTARAMDTTVAKEGTQVQLHASQFNVAVGEALWLPEGCGWRCSNTQTRICVRVLNPPADELQMNCTLYVKEI
jgi:hypothetical protein